MSFFDKIYNQLFPQKKAIGSIPVLTEPIKRNQEELNAYFKWLNEKQHRSIVGHLYNAWEKKLLNESHDFQVHVLQMPYASGFALTYHHSMGKAQFQFLFDYLRDRVQNVGYRLINSDRRIYDRGEYVESIEKFYLKPPIQELEANKLFDQLYGNILIEAIKIDDKPSFIKLMASVYSDRLYTKALPFNELARKILV